jgi:hypothetical protein
LFHPGSNSETAPEMEESGVRVKNAVLLKGMKRRYIATKPNDCKPNFDSDE